MKRKPAPFSRCLSFYKETCLLGKWFKFYGGLQGKSGS